MSQNLYIHQAMVQCGDDGVWPGLTIEVDTLSLNDANIVAGIAGPLGQAKTLKDLYTLLGLPAQAGEAATAAATITAPPATIAAGTKTVAAAGVPVPLAAVATPCRAVLVRPLLTDSGLASNTKCVKVGTAGAVSFRLAPGDPPLLIPIGDASHVMLNALVNGEGAAGP